MYCAQKIANKPTVNHTTKKHKQQVMANIKNKELGIVEEFTHERQRRVLKLDLKDLNVDTVQTERLRIPNSRTFLPPSLQKNKAKTFTSFTLSGSALMEKNRPPIPLIRFKAWLCRDSCKYFYYKK